MQLFVDRDQRLALHLVVAVAQVGSSGGVDDHAANLQAGLGLAGGAADEGAQPGQQFRQLEGFNEVIVGTAVQAADAVVEGIAGS